MVIRKVTSAIILSTFTLTTIGCSAQLDSSAVQATEGAPESAQAEVIAIERDPSLPTFAVAIQPFVFSQTFAPNENAVSINFRSGGEQLAAKLTTALANSGNLSVIDSGLKKNNNGTYSARLAKGEKGPYIIRATVSEFTEVAEAESESSGASLGWLGVVGGIAGAVTGKPGLTWAGAGVAAADPSYNDSKSAKKGVVSIDFQVVDGKTSRVIGAFKASGTFKSASATSGFSLFGVGKQSSKFAQSALGQAVTMAINDAVRKITDTIKQKA